MSEFKAIDIKDENLVGQLLVFLTNDARLTNKRLLEIETKLDGKIGVEQMEEYRARLEQLEEYREKLEIYMITEKATKKAKEDYAQELLEEQRKNFEDELAEKQAALIEQDLKNSRTKNIQIGVSIVGSIIMTAALLYFYFK